MADDKLDPFANLGNFKPRTEPKPQAISEDIERISKDNNFPSRQAVQAEPSKKARFRSLRKQLNIKVREEDFDRFYRMAAEQEISKLGDLFKLALDALEEKQEAEKEEKGV